VLAKTIDVDAKILFYFHKSAEINGRIVKEMLVDKAGLSEEEAWKLLH
jgi:hypothetical protein